MKFERLYQAELDLEMGEPTQGGTGTEVGQDTVEAGDFDLDPMDGLVTAEGQAKTPEEVVEESYLDGKYKSVKELEAYAKRLELERDYTQNSDISPADLGRYGINLETIPVEVRTQLNQAAQAYMGQSLEAVMVELAEGRRLRQENNNLRASKQVEAQQLELKEAWGENFTEIMAAVKAEYQTLPENEKAAYNTVRGALNLGAKHQLSLLKKQAAATPRVPETKTQQMLRSSSPSKAFSSGKKIYSLEAIEAKMESDPGWYSRNAKAIGQLYAENRIQ
jgi:hypothetical protein